MITYSISGNSDFNVNYTGPLPGDVFNIQGTVTKDKKVLNILVKQVANGKPILGGINYVNFDPAST